tara:strand:+ start:552 stop:1529 length:978 start_codon:yes stop_codon:yes gene_type:complete
MDALGKCIESHRKLNTTTLKNYMRVLTRLFLASGKSTVEQFLETAPTQLYIIKGYKQSTQMPMLSAVIVALDSKIKDLTAHSSFQSSLMLYRDYMKELSPILEHRRYEGKKSEKESDNWCSLEDLKECIPKNRKMITKLMKRTDLSWKEFNLFQNYLISCLYVQSEENPPRRLDYRNLKIIKLKDFKKEHLKDQNYLIIKSAKEKSFLFQDFKTVKSTGVVEIPCGVLLNKILNEYIRVLNKQTIVKNNEFLLFNNKGMAVDPSGFGSNITEAFAHSKKNISVNLIRHIFLSKNADSWTLLKRKEMSRLMSHSLETQLTYAKINE